MIMKHQLIYCDYMKLKKSEYLYKEHKANGNKLCIVYKIERVDGNYAEGEIVWSKGNIYGWEEGHYIRNICNSTDDYFTIVKKMREDEYLAKIL